MGKVYIITDVVDDFSRATDTMEKAEKIKDEMFEELLQYGFKNEGRVYITTLEVE